MARSIPLVNGRHVLSGGDTNPPIVCGSAAWYAWLETATIFAFKSDHGTFTARRQPGRPGTAGWRAYRRGSGKVHSIYLGQGADLTPDRLAAAAITLARTPAPGARPSGAAAGMPADPPPLPILPTKLYTPAARPDVVARPHLLARLAAGVAGPLTLICAPAGFGKTTLLAAWCGQTSPPPVAWLSLDAEDSDPLHFLRYLVAALRTTAPANGATLLGLLQATPPPPRATLLSVLINDLAALPAPTILVLDDYHVLQGAAIHDLLTFLVDHLPAPLHLVIATREDPPLPLARLRARRQLIELRAADLRFTTDEAAAFLREVMGLDLPASAVAALEARTEGWIAGLQLAALSLRDQPDVAGFITAFTGSHRYILDYLIEEVLNRQTPPVQRFLVCTSFLDRLCGPLCDAVCAGLDPPATPPDGAPGSQAMLLALERANCFLVPLDAERHWYRYHHLFGDLLRAWLAREPASFRQALHRRASAWYAQEGLTAEAVEHALAGADFAGAIRLIERSAEPLWRQGELATLQRWLAALPPEIVQGQVRLLLTQAWTRFLQGASAHKEVAPLLAQAERLLDQPPARPDAAPADEPAELRGILLAIRSSLAGKEADAAQAIALAQEALACLPARSSYWRGAAELNLGVAYLSNGDLAAANHSLGQARHSALAGGDHYAALAATVHLARIQDTQGHLKATADLLQQALDLAARPGVGLIGHTATVHLELSRVLYEWNDLASAAAHLTEGLERGQWQWQSALLPVAYADLARVKQVLGDSSGATALLDRAAQAAQASGLAWAVGLVETYWVRLWLAQGHPAAEVWRVGQWLAQVADPPEPRPDWVAERAQLIGARALLVQGHPDAALDLLQQCAQAAADSAHTLREIHLLTALARQAQGAPGPALTALRAVLPEAENEGCRRLFLDEGPPMERLLRAVQAQGLASAYVATLLAHFAGGVAAATGLPPATSRAPVAASQVEPLTEREQAVLRLLAAGLGGPEIAAALVVSPSTIKTHLKNLYSKLDAHSRDQALARAHALHLL